MVLHNKSGIVSLLVCYIYHLVDTNISYLFTYIRTCSVLYIIMIFMKRREYRRNVHWENILQTNRHRCHGLTA